MGARDVPVANEFAPTGGGRGNRDDLRTLGFAAGGAVAFPVMADQADMFTRKAFEKMGLAQARRHAFLCIGPNCCATADGQATWETLKRLIKELNVPALRTKADCLRICQGGPNLVVYPEGVWYAGVTPERCERIVREHLLAGNPVEEWIVARHPLP